MEQILRIFYNNGSFITFVGLQLLCFYLIVNFNATQRAIAAETWTVRAGGVKDAVSTFQDYLDLREENEIQQRENAELRSKLQEYQSNRQGVTSDSIQDLIYGQRFTILAANVVNRSSYSPNNTAIIDRGNNFRIQAGQGVLGDEGLLGIVDVVSTYHTRIISILHRATRISAGLRNNAFGTLQWDGRDPRRMTLTDIAEFYPVSPGDTVFTTGYSSVFPTGQVIGTVESMVIQAGTGSQNLVVRLINDPLATRNAFVVQDLFKDDIAPLNTSNQ
jgi:rod shape-determining protein MreC